MNISLIYFADKYLMIHNKGIHPWDICSRQLSLFDEARILKQHILSVTETPLTEDEQSLHTIVLRTTSSKLYSKQN